MAKDLIAAELSSGNESWQWKLQGEFEPAPPAPSFVFVCALGSQSNANSSSVALLQGQGERLPKTWLGAEPEEQGDIDEEKDALHKSCLAGTRVGL